MLGVDLSLKGGEGDLKHECYEGVVHFTCKEGLSTDGFSKHPRSRQDGHQEKTRETPPIECPGVVEQ